ncbi:MAG TPA: hypothetical protein VIR05_02530 [Luteimonas sp.]
MKAPKDPTGQPAEAAPETRSQRADRWAQAMVDGLNRNVRAEHEDPGAPDEDAAHSQRWQEIGAEIAAKRQSAEPLTHKESSRRRAQAMVDGLNRHVMARHEADLAALPPEVRASRTSEEWLATPPLEILRLAREAKATPSQVAPVPGRKGWARRAVEAIAARLRPASAGK